MIWLIVSVVLGLVVVALPDVKKEEDLKSVVAVLLVSLVLLVVAEFVFNP
jgi:membrane protein DedA with SNARE-associated domain